MALRHAIQSSHWPAAYRPIRTATTRAAAVASICSCRRFGSATSMPSRVMKTGRRSRIVPTAVRRFAASHTKAAMNTIVNSVPWLRSIVA
jgi:hypothetical protein